MLSLCRELIFLKIIKSPHVISLEEVIRTKNNYYSVLEYANGGSLGDLLNKKKRFSEKFAREAIQQIIKGCSALYRVGVMHRDLKLDNILVHFPAYEGQKAVNYNEIDIDNEEFVVKIADLGYAREFKKDGNNLQRAYSFKGSPLMMPAE